MVPGGPGASSMLGLFCLNGPFYIDESLNLNLRNGTTWTLNHSVLYIDNPVGAGIYVFQGFLVFVKAERIIGKKIMQNFL